MRDDIDLGCCEHLSIFFVIRKRTLYKNYDPFLQAPPVEVLSLADLENAVRLVTAAIYRIRDKEAFIPA